MVQRRPRYIVGCTPRVNGCSPGNPSLDSRPGATSSGVYSRSMGVPAVVSKRSLRSGLRASTGSTVSRCQRSFSVIVPSRGFELDENGALLHRLTGAHEDARDDPGTFRLQLVLHLHRFHHGYALPAHDLLARLHLDAHDEARHG